MIGICPTSRQGVAVVEYSGRFSRMWTWDALSLEVTGFQDIKARIQLLDVSRDGKYCAYFAEAHRKDEHYIAISRPPYFRALWIRNAYHLGGTAAFFGSKRVFTAGYVPKWVANGRYVPEKIAPYSPFRFKESDDLYQSKDYQGIVPARCSGAVSNNRYPWYPGRLSKRDVWVGSDPLGRNIIAEGSHVLADGVRFLDCSRTPFTEVVPPDWASHW